MLYRKKSHFVILHHYLVFVQVPVSQCSAPCPTGSRQARRPREPHCCFDCLPCADGEISNQTGRFRYYINCKKQKVITTIELQLCGLNIFLLYVSLKVPLSVQNVLSFTGQTKKR